MSKIQDTISKPNEDTFHIPSVTSSKRVKKHTPVLSKNFFVRQGGSLIEPYKKLLLNWHVHLEENLKDKT